MLNEAQNVVGSVEKSTRLLSGRPKFTPWRGSGNSMLAVFKAPMLGHPPSQANVSAAHKHLIWLAHRGKLRQRQKIKACVNAVLKSWLRLMGQFFLITVLAKVDMAERVPLFTGTTFLYLNGA